MPGLAEQVWIISEGNPFAVVETVRALPEGRGADPSAKLAVPRRVRDVIARHLEALSERGRDLTTVAAVIGREFDFPLLCRSAGLEESEAAEALEELVRRRVLHSVGDRFDFTHDRIREVAYAGLLRERQRALHARVADSIETLYADRLAEQVERLAHHAARGELGEKAVGYLRQAGAKAFANSAHTDALAYFTQALELLEKLAPGAARDREELSLRLALGPALQVREATPTPEVEQNYARARQLADEVGAPVQQFQARWGIWLVASHRASGGTALELGRDLLALAERLDDPALLLEGHHALWPVLVWLGKADAARPHLDQRDGALRQGAAPEPRVRLWRPRPRRVLPEGRQLGFLDPRLPGTGSRGECRLARAGQGARSSHEHRCRARLGVCLSRPAARVPRAVREHARALIALSTEHETPQWLAAGTIIDGSVQRRARRGRRRRSPRSRRGLAAYRSTGAHLFVPYFLSLLARACLKDGEPREGLRVIREALERRPHDG